MRKTCLTIGCVALLALTGASVASTGYSFSRPNTEYSQFRDDQRMCERTSYTAYLEMARPPTGFTHRGPAGQVSVGSTRATPPSDGELRLGFKKCMERKGYRLDSSGLRTGPLWTWVRHW